MEQDSYDMLWALEGSESISDRQLRLYVCAGARRLEPHLSEDARELLRLGEDFADG